MNRQELASAGYVLLAVHRLPAGETPADQWQWFQATDAKLYALPPAVAAGRVMRLGDSWMIQSEWDGPSQLVTGLVAVD